jgi:cytochrome c6
MSRSKSTAGYLLRLRRIAPVGWGALALAVLPSLAFAQSDGASLFAQNCSACHQLNGKGISGAFPALAGNALVNGEPQGFATVVLNGRGGMPAFGNDLSDQDIAAITTYVRSTWGNHAGAVTGAVVKAVRKGREPPADKSADQAH